MTMNYTKIITDTSKVDRSHWNDLYVWYLIINNKGGI